MSSSLPSALNTQLTHSQNRLQKTFEEIFAKYENIQESETDVINLVDMNLIIDNGDLESFNPLPFGLNVNYVAPPIPAKVQQSVLVKTCESPLPETSLDDPLDNTQDSKLCIREKVTPQKYERYPSFNSNSYTPRISPGNFARNSYTPSYLDTYSHTRTPLMSYSDYDPPSVYLSRSMHPKYYNEIPSIYVDRKRDRSYSNSTPNHERYIRDFYTPNHDRYDRDVYTPTIYHPNKRSKSRLSVVSKSVDQYSECLI